MNYRQIISDIEQEIAKKRASVDGYFPHRPERLAVESEIAGMLAAMAIVERYEQLAAER